MVGREAGAVLSDIPIFAMSESLTFHCASSSNASSGPTSLTSIPGAIVIPDALSPSECDQLIKLTESAGYGEDAPTRLGRHVRHNDNCVLVANTHFNNLIFERCQASLPPTCCGGGLCGINRRWRFYKYHPGDIFRAHIDPGGWTGSGFDDGVLIPDCFGDRVSRMTLLLYLNDEFTGGATRFFKDPHRPQLGNAGNCSEVVSVEPSQGNVLCFFHGHHPLSPWHEGASLLSGTKYVLRTDVLYKTS